MNNIDLSKSMPITCAFSCESNAYRITIRQQAAKIAELEARLEIDTLNPNRREHIVKLTTRIDELNTYLDNIKDQLVDALSTNYEIEKECEQILNSALDSESNYCDSKNKIAELDANNKNLVEKNAFLRQRPDLPVDRLPAYTLMKNKIEELEEIIRGRDELIDNAVSSRIAELEANQLKAEALIAGLREQVFDCPHLDDQVELYFTLKDKG
jgi:chromosome segregation ATPase